jgi:iron complex transport system ATP-binding protein
MGESRDSMLLNASGLTFSYGTRPVLRAVSVSLAPGEVVALLGPNGSGKSTLIRVLIGHLPASDGKLRWDGRDIEQWRRRELARRVAYLPQEPGYEPGQRVGDVLRLGRAPYWSMFGIESARDLEVISTVAEQLDLGALLDRPVDEISGGQRQMVFLARAMVQEPAAMLLDEPSTFLDLRHQVELMALLKKLARESNVGILMASHDLNLAAAGADRLILLDHGAVASEGTPAQVLEPELLGRVYGVTMERIEREGASPRVAPVLLP